MITAIGGDSSVPTQQPKQQNPGRCVIDRGWIRWRLIRDLAAMDMTNADLADKYGVNRSTIGRFAKRYAAEIDEVKAQIDDEMAGLWIASKQARIAEYQQSLEDINDLLALDLDPETAPKKVSDPDDPDATEMVIVGAKLPALLKAKATVLHQVAEEMGQLPARVQVNVNDQRVNYTIEGVDLAALR